MPIAPAVGIRAILDARRVPRGERLRDRLDAASRRDPPPPIEIHVLRFQHLDRRVFERSTAIILRDDAYDDASTP
ncbi:MAG: hypothetical protein CMJ27_03325 [Phycisphaerae bacterium]|nr:hypothetical protein [Phycisphaerae bacterium]OUX02670.1 MAG: hypothetical protein CBD91_02010 [Phycisphaeraceae bacterium TMED231]